MVGFAPALSAGPRWRQSGCPGTSSEVIDGGGGAELLRGWRSVHDGWRWGAREAFVWRIGHRGFLIGLAGEAFVRGSGVVNAGHTALSMTTELSVRGTL